MTHNPVSGILNINKPAGMTSHDVVNRIRKLVGTKKVGHTGTLDPMATGVLLVCIGQATRLIEYLVGGEKVYRATLRLGQATTTFDAEGEITATTPAEHITADDLLGALTPFTGTIQQTPPAYSAIKKGGVPLYKLARKGIDVIPEPRTVQINRITLNHYTPPHAEITISCGAGTYIRSIAHDVGQALNVGAHLTQLTRLANGQWTQQNAVSLTQLAQAVAEDRLASLLHRKEEAIAHLPRLTLSAEEETRVSMGQKLPNTTQLQAPAIAAFTATGTLAAIMIPREPNLLKPQKVFI